MNMRSSQHGFGKSRSQREVIDIPEAVPRDKSLDKLIALRKQRLQRLERERDAARETWRSDRRNLRDEKQRWRMGVQASKDYWKAARAEFFSMATTSGQFRKAKAIYERMKIEAEEVHLDCRTIASRCKESRELFFNARKVAVEANRNHERLNILRDEIRSLQVITEL